MKKKNEPQSLRQRMQRNWYWLILVALALVAVVYSYQQRANCRYWEGAIGNWLATLLGIIAGVPIALAIERQRISREERERAAEQQEEAKKISSLIRDELVYNSDGLAERIKNQNISPRRPLKSDLWRALSDSGEIRWIDNASVLNKIASAYFYIGVVSAIEDKYYQALRGVNPKYRDGTLASGRLLRDARKFDSELNKSLSTAISSIEEIYGVRSAA